MFVWHIPTNNLFRSIFNRLVTPLLSHKTRLFGEAVPDTVVVTFSIGVGRPVICGSMILHLVPAASWETSLPVKIGSWVRSWWAIATCFASLPWWRHCLYSLCDGEGDFWRMRTRRYVWIMPGTRRSWCSRHKVSCLAFYGVLVWCCFWWLRFVWSM
jgi:hypothetical protein